MLSRDEAIALLRSWAEAHQHGDIQFRDSDAPAHDPSDDYQIVYEARWLPGDIDKMAVEVWVAPNGSVAVGLDTRERVATRVGVPSRRPGFATGCEPLPLS